MDAGQHKPLFPWYKERLQTKYLKASTTKLPSLNLVMDDSYPAPTWIQEVISPVIFTTYRDHHCCYTTMKVPRPPVSKKHACFSRQMIQKQKRREYVAAVEDKLRQPLAQYQQYMNYMPAELFEKLLAVLDPKEDTPKL